MIRAIQQTAISYDKPRNSKIFGQVYRLISDHQSHSGKSYFADILGLRPSIERAMFPFDSDRALGCLPSLDPTNLQTFAIMRLVIGN